MDGRQRDYCKGFLNLSGCGFSLVTLGHRRTSSITTVCTIRSIHTEQPGCTLHWLWLQKPSSPGVFSPSNSHGGVIGADKTITALKDSMRSCKSSGVSLGVVAASMFQMF